MARNTSLILIATLVMSLAACGEEFVPGEPIALTTAEKLGVPKGADVFQSEDDAAEFDEHVTRYADMRCKTLAATIAALQAREEKQTGTTRRIARVGGAVLPGPAGSLARAALGELSSASAARGNIRLSAAEAVRVAKGC